MKNNENTAERLFKKLDEFAKKITGDHAAHRLNAMEPFLRIINIIFPIMADDITRQHDCRLCGFHDDIDGETMKPTNRKSDLSKRIIFCDVFEKPIPENGIKYPRLEECLEIFKKECGNEKKND